MKPPAPRRIWHWFGGVLVVLLLVGRSGAPVQAAPHREGRSAAVKLGWQGVTPVPALRALDAGAAGSGGPGAGLAVVPPLPKSEVPSVSLAARWAAAPTHESASSSLAIRSAPGRPAPLIPLYVSFAALQVADVVSTYAALQDGAMESNPLLRGLAHNPVAMLAVKGGATVLSFYLSERLWKKSRRASIVLMIALNAGYAAVVAHNSSKRR